MARKPKNPIDPATGKRRRGRPFKTQPIHTIAGPQATESAIGSQQLDIDDSDVNAVVVKDLNPDTATMTELSKMWYDRMGGSTMMTVPHELQKQYPDGQFCWARDTKECVSEYRTRFGYKVVEATNPLPGQTDSSFRHGDALLMVRPKWTKKVHDQLRRDTLAAQMGNPTPKGADERGAERDALREASSAGYDQGSKALSFFAEDEQEDAERVAAEEKAGLKKMFMNQPGRPRLATGTRYIAGGISK